MHCTTSGAPGSLLPDTMLGSPRSHRSEYCPWRGSPPPGWAAWSHVHVHLGACQDRHNVCVCVTDSQASTCLCMCVSKFLWQGGISGVRLSYLHDGLSETSVSPKVTLP